MTFLSAIFTEKIHILIFLLHADCATLPSLSFRSTTSIFFGLLMYHMFGSAQVGSI